MRWSTILRANKAAADFAISSPREFDALGIPRAEAISRLNRAGTGHFSRAATNALRGSMLPEGGYKGILRASVTMRPKSMVRTTFNPHCCSSTETEAGPTKP
jgi:hypothetical protein